MKGLKKRLSNKTTVLAIAGLFLVLAQQIASLFGYNIDIASDKIDAIITTVVLILVGLGVIIDPTTPGITDKDEGDVDNDSKT